MAGGGSKLERGTRYTLHVRPMHVHKNHGYALEAMGIKQPAHEAIDLLVEYDHAYFITALRTISAPTNSGQHPSAAYTRLGWTIFGEAILQPRAVVSNLSSVHHVQRIEEEDDLKALFYSAVAGVKPTSACVCSDKELAEVKFLKHAKTTTEITDEERIRIRMPWLDGYPDSLPFNKEKTVYRTYQHESALKRKGRLKEYNKEIRDLLTQGFVHPLTPAEANDGRGWYLLHHAVYRENKSSTNVRIVWNATAQFRSVSLYDGFHKGPDLLYSFVSCHHIDFRLLGLGAAT